MAGPGEYRAALLEARRQVGALELEQARKLERALREYVAALVRGVGPKPSPELVRIVSQATREWMGVVADATAVGRRVSFDRTLEKWEEAGERVARASGGEAILGQLRPPPFTMLGAFEALGGAVHWRTSLGAAAGLGGREVGSIVRQAITAGVGPDELSRRLRGYMDGSKPFHKLFTEVPVEGGGVWKLDLRDIPAEMRGAARRMVVNANRAASSELHNARAEAEVEHFIRDPYIDGVRWRLSPNRGVSFTPPDECDVLAGSDFYDMGPGVFPVFAVPSPPHPYDRCEREPVTRSTARLGEAKRNPPTPKGPELLRRVVIPGGATLTKNRRGRILRQVGLAMESGRALTEGAVKAGLTGTPTPVAAVAALAAAAPKPKGLPTTLDECATAEELVEVFKAELAAKRAGSAALDQALEVAEEVANTAKEAATRALADFRDAMDDFNARWTGPGQLTLDFGRLRFRDGYAVTDPGPGVLPQAITDAFEKWQGLAKASSDALAAVVRARAELNSVVANPSGTAFLTRGRAPTPVDVDVRVRKQPLKGTIEAGVDVFRRIIPKQYLDEMNAFLATADPTGTKPGRKSRVPVVHGAPKKGRTIRAFREGGNRAYAWSELATVHIDDFSSMEVVVHELIHVLERWAPHLGQKAIAWRERRTVGETLQKLQKLHPGRGYGSHEVTKPDGFFSTYVGKVYNSPTSSEVLTMGVQRMLEDPLDFWDKDPDHFRLIFDLLTGRL